MKRTTRDVLHDARDSLRTAERGLADLSRGDAERRLAGLRNAVVFGRAVTNILENLRSLEPTFDTWYKPKSRALSEEPLMKFFYKLRTEILKEGSLPVATVLEIRNLEMPLDPVRFGTPPPGASHIFVGDAIGGVGWIVTRPDGSTEKYYVEIPDDVGVIETSLVGAPGGERSASELVGWYLKRMRELVEEAERLFGGAG